MGLLFDKCSFQLSVQKVIDYMTLSMTLMLSQPQEKWHANILYTFYKNYVSTTHVVFKIVSIIIEG